MKNKVAINPRGLLKNPAFSQIMTTTGNGKTIYIGGQNAVNAEHEIIGKDNILEQTDQVMKNLSTALQASGATLEHLVKLNINIVQGQDAYGAFQISQKFMSQVPDPPVITVVFVAGLINPDFLLEIDAIAFLPA